LSMVLLILEVCHNGELAGTINPLIPTSLALEIQQQANF